MDKNMTLEKRIAAELYCYQGKMSVFVDDLQGHTVEVGADEEFETASTIKAFILAALYLQAQRGKADLAEEITYEQSQFVDGSGMLRALGVGAKLKVKALAQLTSIYTGSSNLFVVPYTKPQEYIRDNAPDVLFTVLMRRSMMRIANVIAKKQGCEALVTGESLAQVASQTVKALQCTDAAQDLPILRPLIGMDKTEIVETARHINTFETSILPYEDCCTIFTPPHPKIRPELAEILEAEAAMPGRCWYAALPDRTGQRRTCRAGSRSSRERRAHPHPYHRSGRI